MGIIPEQVQPQETLESVIYRIKSLNLQMCRQLEMMHKQAFNFVWNNPSFTAKQIVDGFGTDAAALFQSSSTVQNLLASINPSYQALQPPLAFTVNADGTVTVSE